MCYSLKSVAEYSCLLLISTYVANKVCQPLSNTLIILNKSWRLKHALEDLVICAR